MKAPAEYLRAAKIQELAAQLQQRGYQVDVRPLEADDYSLTAVKNGAKVAYEVVAGTEFKSRGDQVRRHRRRAHDEGFTEFHLAVVNPPREVRVEIAGLKDVLREHLRANIPSKLSSLAARIAVSGVVRIEYDSVAITHEAIDVKGAAIVQVGLEGVIGEQGDSANGSDAFPFTFEISLDHQLGLRAVQALSIDTSDF